jgi:pimeloyl-ACP methyl ester carboxylesterase
VETFRSFDGVRISYRDLGNGRAVLLHHGFASDSEINWIRPGVAAAITEAGRRAILIDARGHGSSDKPHDPVSYEEGAMVRDAQALLDRLDLGEVDVVGYSMGAVVNIGLALADARVRSIVLGGAGTRQASTTDPDQAARIGQGLLAEDKSQITDRMALAFRNFADATGADRRALAAYQRARRNLISSDALASIDIPTLVVNGEGDALVGRPESLAEAIPGAEFVSVPGDHISAVTKPEFRRAIVEFLERQPL